MEHRFYFKQRLTNYGYAGMDIHLADISFQMNKVSLLPQEQQRTVFVANDKTWA